MGKPELTAEQKAAKTALKTQVDAAEAKAKESNDSRKDKGTRLTVSLTRGRNPQVITYEEFDESKPETLPTTLSEFMDLTKINDEKDAVAILIDGFNSTAYTTASDPIAEFVEATWPDEIKKTFRTVVRNYASGANISLDDAVKLIKPGIVAVHGPK